MARGLSRRDFLKLGGAGLAGASVLGVTGCGSVFGGGDEGGGGNGRGGKKTLNVYTSSEIPDLNQFSTTAIIPFEVLTNMMDGLYRLDPEGKPVPAQAESVDVSGDKKTYTFKLRDGIKWSDGSEVTPEDFRFSWLTAMDPDTGCPYAFILSDYVEGGADYNAGKASADSVGIEVPDEKTLKVTLSNPTPFFLNLTAFPTYFPVKQDFYEKSGDDFALSPDGFLYNGPYTMTGLSPTSEATLAKNPKYWDSGNVGVEEITMKVIEESSTALNLYQSGELDTVTLNSDSVDRFRDSSELETISTFTTYYIMMNHEEKALANEDIRRAIQLGFDRESYVKNILNDGSKAADGLVPLEMNGPGGDSFREAYGAAMPAYDPEEAKAHWRKGVRELGRKPTLTLTVSDSSVMKDTGTFLQGQFQKNLGANVKIEVKPFDALLDSTEKGDFQMAVSDWIADYDDPMTYLDLWVTGSSQNDLRFSNEEYDSLISSAKTETDEKKRMDMLSRAERILLDEQAAMAPVYYASLAVLVKPDIKQNVTLPSQISEYQYWKIGDK